MLHSCYIYVTDREAPPQAKTRSKKSKKPKDPPPPSYEAVTKSDGGLDVDDDEVDDISCPIEPKPSRSPASKNPPMQQDYKVE